VSDSGLPTLRSADFSLGESETAIRDTFARFFNREVPLSRVREAAPLGYDAKLWSQLGETDAVTAALPDRAGGGLVAGALATEQMGRVLAPVPLVEAMTAARLLDQLGPGAAQWAQALTGGSRLVSVALHPLAGAKEQIVSAGAVADAVVVFDGHQLVLVDRGQPPE
jgi:Acyl-CoA dehydrogenase, N-terminal domain